MCFTSDNIYLKSEELSLGVTDLVFLLMMVKELPISF